MTHIAVHCVVKVPTGRRSRVADEILKFVIDHSSPMQRIATTSLFINLAAILALISRH